jgi:Na+/melibiose symporter-like transporter
MLSHFSICYLLPMVDSVFAFYLLDYLVSSVGFPGSTAGLVLLLTELVNVFVGPITAFLVQNARENLPLGKYRFLSAATMLPMAMLFIAIFWPPSAQVLSSRITSVAYFTVLIALFNMFYGSSLLLYEAMIPLLAKEEQELVTFNSRRLFIGTASSVIMQVIAAFGLPSLVPDAGQRLFVIACSVGILLSLLFYSWIALVVENAAPTLSILSPTASGSRATSPSAIAMACRGSRSCRCSPRPMKLPRFDVLSPIADSNKSNPPVVPSEAVRAKTCELSQARLSLFGRMAVRLMPVRQLFKTRHFVVMLLNNFFYWLFAMISSSALPFYVRDYLHLDISNFTRGAVDAPEFFAALLVDLGSATAQVYSRQI